MSENRKFEDAFGSKSTKKSSQTSETENDANKSCEITGLRSKDAKPPIFESFRDEQKESSNLETKNSFQQDLHNFLKNNKHPKADCFLDKNKKTEKLDITSDMFFENNNIDDKFENSSDFYKNNIINTPNDLPKGFGFRTSLFSGNNLQENQQEYIDSNQNIRVQSNTCFYDKDHFNTTDFSQNAIYTNFNEHSSKTNSVRNGSNQDAQVNFHTTKSDSMRFESNSHSHANSISKNNSSILDEAFSGLKEDHNSEKNVSMPFESSGYSHANSKSKNDNSAFNEAFSGLKGNYISKKSDTMPFESSGYSHTSLKSKNDNFILNDVSQKLGEHSTAHDKNPTHTDSIRNFLDYSGGTKNNGSINIQNKYSHHSTEQEQTGDNALITSEAIGHENSFELDACKMSGSKDFLSDENNISLITEVFTENEQSGIHSSRANVPDQKSNIHSNLKKANISDQESKIHLNTHVDKFEAFNRTTPGNFDPGSIQRANPSHSGLYKMNNEEFNYTSSPRSHFIEKDSVSYEKSPHDEIHQKHFLNNDPTLNASVRDYGCSLNQAEKIDGFKNKTNNTDFQAQTNEKNKESVVQETTIDNLNKRKCLLDDDPDLQNWDDIDGNLFDNINDPIDFDINGDFDNLEDTPESSYVNHREFQKNTSPTNNEHKDTPGFSINANTKENDYFSEKPHSHSKMQVAVPIELKFYSSGWGGVIDLCISDTENRFSRVKARANSPYLYNDTHQDFGKKSVHNFVQNTPSTPISTHDSHNNQYRHNTPYSNNQGHFQKTPFHHDQKTNSHKNDMYTKQNNLLLDQNNRTTQKQAHSFMSKTQVIDAFGNKASGFESGVFIKVPMSDLTFPILLSFARVFRDIINENPGIMFTFSKPSVNSAKNANAMMPQKDNNMQYKLGARDYSIHHAQRNTFQNTKKPEYSFQNQVFNRFDSVTTHSPTFKQSNRESSAYISGLSGFEESDKNSQFHYENRAHTPSKHKTAYSEDKGFDVRKSAYLTALSGISIEDVQDYGKSDTQSNLEGNSLKENYLSTKSAEITNNGFGSEISSISGFSDQKNDHFDSKEIATNSPYCQYFTPSKPSEQPFSSFPKASATEVPIEWQFYQKSHEGVKRPFEGDLQPKKFRGVSENAEKDIDVLMMPLQCNICGLRFNNTASDKDSLNNHIDDHIRRLSYKDSHKCREYFLTVTDFLKIDSEKLNLHLLNSFLKSKVEDCVFKVSESCVCDSCGMSIKNVWDDDCEDFVAKDVVKTGDNTYRHKKCAL